MLLRHIFILACCPCHLQIGLIGSSSRHCQCHGHWHLRCKCISGDFTRWENSNDNEYWQDCHQWTRRCSRACRAFNQIWGTLYKYIDSGHKPFPLRQPRCPYSIPDATQGPSLYDMFWARHRDSIWAPFRLHQDWKVVHWIKTEWTISLAMDRLLTVLQVCAAILFSYYLPNLGL